MVVIVLGVDHRFQQNDEAWEFEYFVAGLVKETPFQLIAEEAEHGKETVARRLALKASIRWLNVDLTECERKRLEIFDELKARVHPWLERGKCVGERACFLPHADGIREDHWVDRVMRENVPSVLIVCGVLHMQSVQRRLVAQGCDVSRVVNTCETRWYKERYGEVRLFQGPDGAICYELRYKTPIPNYR